MHRSDWELAVAIRHHIAELGGQRRAHVPIDRGSDVPARVMTHLRHRLGIGLIHVGQALVGYRAAGASDAACLHATLGCPGS